MASTPPYPCNSLLIDGIACRGCLHWTKRVIQHSLRPSANRASSFPDLRPTITTIISRKTSDLTPCRFLPLPYRPTTSCTRPAPSYFAVITQDNHQIPLHLPQLPNFTPPTCPPCIPIITTLHYPVPASHSPSSLPRRRVPPPTPKPSTPTPPTRRPPWVP